MRTRLAASHFWPKDWFYFRPPPPHPSSPGAVRVEKGWWVLLVCQTLTETLGQGYVLRHGGCELNRSDSLTCRQVKLRLLNHRWQRHVGKSRRGMISVWSTGREVWGQFVARRPRRDVWVEHPQEWSYGLGSHPRSSRPINTNQTNVGHGQPLVYLFGWLLTTIFAPCSEFTSVTGWWHRWPTLNGWAIFGVTLLQIWHFSRTVEESSSWLSPLNLSRILYYYYHPHASLGKLTANTSRDI